MEQRKEPGVTGRQRLMRLAALAAGLAALIAVTVAVSSNGSSGTGIDFRGKPTVVNFFASWCTACDDELPGFARLSTALRGKVNFVGVDSLETGDRLFMPRRHHITWWPLARDVGGAQGSGLHDALGGGSAMPLTAFYDAQGRLVEVNRAALPEDALRAKLRALYDLTV